MDYSRIYSCFIEDRRSREGSLIGYTERHHILPRSLGGLDDPGNLIRLKPEDHFFAHLLLAKIHGGRLWAPVAFMVKGQRKDYRPIYSRKSYGWAARAMAKALRGEGAHQFDHTIYELEHEDGRHWSGRQSEMPNLGFSRAMANLLIKGRCNSAKGWFRSGRRPIHVGRGLGGGQRHAMADHVKRHFRHVDGREFIGTQIEFREISGVSKPGCTRLVRGQQTISRGWYLDGVTPQRKGRAAAYTR